MRQRHGEWEDESKAAPERMTQKEWREKEGEEGGVGRDSVVTLTLSKKCHDYRDASPGVHAHTCSEWPLHAYTIYRHTYTPGHTQPQKQYTHSA